VRGKNTSADDDEMPSSSVRRKIQWWCRKRGGYPLPSLSSFEKLDGDGDRMEDDEDVIQSQYRPTREDGGITPPSSNDCGQPLMSEKDATEKANRKVRRKKMNATIPCRFYNQKNGCWRGDRCMFLHSKVPLMNTVEKTCLTIPTSQVHETINAKSCTAAVPAEVEDAMDTDMMDELTNQIQSKARISIPAKISFGRRRLR